jgi:hypothetical protein
MIHHHGHIAAVGDAIWTFVVERANGDDERRARRPRRDQAPASGAT